MKTSSIGIKLLKYFEGCMLVAYPDPKTKADPWTIGWGATGKGINKGLVWTQQQADDRLTADATIRELIVLKHFKQPMTQGEFDAAVSIVFNVGEGSPTKDGIIRLKNGNPSTLLRKFNAGDKQGALAEWVKWISPGSAVERGLLRRRKAEVSIFLGSSFEDAIKNI